ncbi:MAG: hypothetical protein IPK39_11775 [Sulfuritalea sp.]|nr:hypothetical protein [Sulfuritalea sp.]
MSMLAIALGINWLCHPPDQRGAALADFSQAMPRVQGRPDAVIAPAPAPRRRMPLALIRAVCQGHGRGHHRHR